MMSDTSWVNNPNWVRKASNVRRASIIAALQWMDCLTEDMRTHLTDSLLTDRRTFLECRRIQKEAGIYCKVCREIEELLAAKGDSGGLR